MGELKRKARGYAASFGGATQLADEGNRSFKAEKIRAVLQAAGAWRDSSLRLLDVGCSHGIILRKLSGNAHFGVGADFDLNSLGTPGPNTSFVCCDAELLPFFDRSFDVVVCNHVYEHTDEPEQLLNEIARVLAPRGVCYFAGPNKHDLVEPHYGLPFLSWLPRFLADRYLRLTGKGTAYVERPYSYSKLRDLLSGFEIEDYTAGIVNEPERYHATDVLVPGSLKQRLARLVLRVAPFFFPGFVFVLRNRS